MLGLKKQNQNLFLMAPHPHVFGQHKLNLVVNKKKLKRWEPGGAEAVGWVQELEVFR